MKSMYLTKEGVLTESITSVYVSEDKEYYSESCNNVGIYNKFKIKDFESLVPEKVVFHNQTFYNPDISYSDLDVTYTMMDDDNFYVSFKIDKNFNKDTIEQYTPIFSRWDRCSELFLDFPEDKLETYVLMYG